MNNIRNVYDANISRIDHSERSIVHYISTPALNRNGHIINQFGIDNENFKKNPIVLYSHNYGGTMFTESTDIPVIGNSLWQKPDESGYLVKTQLYRNTDLTDDLWNLIEQGYKPAWSFGGRALEEAEIVNYDGREVQKYNKTELTEYSWVIIPADPNTVTNNFQPKSIEIRNFMNDMIETKKFDELKKQFEELKNAFDNGQLKVSELENKIAEMHEKTTEEVKAEVVATPTLDEEKIITALTNRYEEKLKYLTGKV